MATMLYPRKFYGAERITCKIFILSSMLNNRRPSTTRYQPLSPWYGTCVTPHKSQKHHLFCLHRDDKVIAGHLCYSDQTFIELSFFPFIIKLMSSHICARHFIRFHVFHFVSRQKVLNRMIFFPYLLMSRWEIIFLLHSLVLSFIHSPSRISRFSSVRLQLP